MVWICPICELGLEKTPQGWSCDNQHSFDQAKEGYVNLLPAHQKRSKNPGDNLEMVLAAGLFMKRTCISLWLRP